MHYEKALNYLYENDTDTYTVPFYYTNDQVEDIKSGLGFDLDCYVFHNKITNQIIIDRVYVKDYMKRLKVLDRINIEGDDE